MRAGQQLQREKQADIVRALVSRRFLSTSWIGSTSDEVTRRPLVQMIMPAFQVCLRKGICYTHKKIVLRRYWTVLMADAGLISGHAVRAIPSGLQGAR